MLQWKKGCSFRLCEMRHVTMHVHEQIKYKQRHGPGLIASFYGEKWAKEEEWHFTHKKF